MDEEFIQQAFAELIQSTGEAIGYVVSAIARDGDAGKLQQNLRAQLEAAKQGGNSSLAVRIATYALAAVEAEVLIQRQHPTKQ